MYTTTKYMTLPVLTERYMNICCIYLNICIYLLFQNIVGTGTRTQARGVQGQHANHYTMDFTHCDC